jgi:hypothetical protein
VWMIAAFLLQLAMPNTSVRYLVPMVPPVILMLLKFSSWAAPSPSFFALCGANLIFVTSIALGDALIGNGYQRIVENLVIPQLERNNGNLYFSGHWGFQYYAQRAGGHVIDKKQEPQYRDGDLILLPTAGIPDIRDPNINSSLHTAMITVSYTPWWPIRTVDVATSANFYGSWTASAGIPTLLPFCINSGPSETFRLYRIQQNKN